MAEVRLFGPDGRVDPALLNMMLSRTLDGFIGKTFVVRFLTSEQGQLLNGRTCDVIGHNGERLEVRMRDDGSTKRIKMCNLLEASAHFGESATPRIGDEEIVRRLRAVLDHPTFDQGTREDMAARIRFVREHLDKGVPPPLSQCMDLMVDPEAQDNDMMKVLASQKACCHGHDGMVDFRRFNEGLVGNGQQCAVCLETLDPSQKTLGFPCGHLFHKRCSAEWLKKNKTCPSCRFKLGLPGDEYTFEMGTYEKRLTTRLNEWFISGMCERCQAVYQEADPLVCLPGLGNRLVPRSQLGEALLHAGDQDIII